MHATDTRRITATAAKATAAAAALTVVSAIAPTSAVGTQPDPCSGSDPQVGTSSETFDIGRYVERRKVAMAQYYVDHARELHQSVAR